jgi:two-component system response regulator QseB
MPVKILVLEDDPLFNETLQDFLEEAGYVLACALDPYTAMDLTYEQNFDLYVLDVNLPYESGFEWLARLRESGDTTPAIFITSREDKPSLVQGFGSGGDDYLTKPVDLDELLLRIGAILRRQRRVERIVLGAYWLDSRQKRLYLGDDEVALTRKVIDLLLLFASSQGETISIDTIKSALWAPGEEASEGSIRVYVAQLKKLFPGTIENFRGVGYRFAMADEVPR